MNVTGGRYYLNGKFPEKVLKFYLNLQKSPKLKFVYENNGL